MLEAPSIGLRIVSGDDLEPAIRAALRPGELIADRAGEERRLPSHFFEVPSWEAAMDTRLAPNFGVWELIDIDVREHRDMRMYPRFLPCAIVLLAAHLQLLRVELGRVVRIAANGGYRSPAHHFSTPITPHCWGTAANIYRIGDEFLDSRARIEGHIATARRLFPGAWIRPYGEEPGYAFDHLHLELGYTVVDPRTTAETGSTRAQHGERPA